MLYTFFRRLKVNAALAGEPIPSEKSILKKCVTFSACLMLYIFFVALFNSTCSVPFLPQHAKCMGSNIEETFHDWHNNRLLLLIPFTLIICTNIVFDFDDTLKTTYITGLFIGTLMFAEVFLKHFDGSSKIRTCLVMLLLIKGPLIAIWTNHRLKQKYLKKNQQEINEVESTLSAQAENSQLESHVLDDIHNNNINVL